MTNFDTVIMQNALFVYIFFKFVWSFSLSFLSIYVNMLIVIKQNVKNHTSRTRKLCKQKYPEHPECPFAIKVVAKNRPVE